MSCPLHGGSLTLCAPALAETPKAVRNKRPRILPKNYNRKRTKPPQRWPNRPKAAPRSPYGCPIFALWLPYGCRQARWTRSSSERITLQCRKRGFGQRCRDLRATQTPSFVADVVERRDRLELPH